MLLNLGVHSVSIEGAGGQCDQSEAGPGGHGQQDHGPGLDTDYHR